MRWRSLALHPLGIRLDAHGMTLEEVGFPLAGLRLCVPVGARTRALGDGVVELTAGSGAPIVFAPAGDTSGGGVAEGVRVHTTGPQAGTISFAARLRASVLDASLRYFYSAPGGAGPTLQALRFPLFHPEQMLPVHALLDPVDPADRTRNAIAIATGDPLTTCFTTTSGRQVRLAVIDGRSLLAPQWDPVAASSYVTPDGDWQLVAATGASGPGADVVLGLSGLEFARVATPATISFVAGNPCYALGFGPTGASGPISLTATCPGSPNPATTAWAYFADVAPGPSGLAPGYYSQPREAGMFEPRGVDPLLSQLAIRAALLPPGPVAPETPGPCFPSAPYGGATGTLAPGADWTQTLSLFEQLVLAPGRARAIEALNPALGSDGPVGVAATTPTPGLQGLTALAVTPQGLLSELSPDRTQWHSLRLAKTSESPGGLALSNIDGRLRVALLGSELFLVISDPDALSKHVAPTAYRVTADVLLTAAERGVPKNDVDAVRAAMLLVTYDTLGRFRTALQAALGTAYAARGPIFVELAGVWELAIDGWRFDLTPAHWSAADTPTIAIVKFCAADLTTLARDPDQWTEAAVFNRNPGDTATALRAALAAAADSSSYFGDTVLGDWNGVLFLNVPVQGDSFPPELRGLAGGIEGPLLARYVGINGSPINTTSGLTVGDSSVFAQIDYRNPEAGDLTYQGLPYGFKVLALHVDFANSHISGFSSHVELLVGQLFGERSTIVDGVNGDNVVFEGTMQRHGAQTSYSFRSAGASLLTVQSAVLGTVTLDSGEFATLVDELEGDRVVSAFTLGGTVRFNALADFDMFSFGPGPDSAAAGAPGLSVSNLVVRMVTTGSGAARATEFSFAAGEATIDIAASVARPDSLYARFPLAVTAVLQGDAAATPASAGYMPVGSPLVAGPLAGGVWFGLAMRLDLGSAGGLAAAAGLSASLLVAWSPSAKGYDAQIGLRLPGAQGNSSALSLMGPLRLDIGKVAFVREPSGSDYLLRLENIVLGFLGLRFPPQGRTNLLLFGNPDPTARGNQLGWYGAYDDAKAPGTGTAGPRALPPPPQVH